MSKNEFLEKHKSERQLTSIYSRVMGYLSPRERYNDSKKQEAEDRTYFDEKIFCDHCKEMA